MNGKARRNNQDIQQTKRNLALQLITPTKKPRVNHSLVIIGTALICTAVSIYSLKEYYLNKQPLKNSHKTKETESSLSPSTAIDKNNVSISKTYKNSQYKIEFDYPQSYKILVNPTDAGNSNYTNCLGLTDNRADCLLSLTIKPTKSDYSPSASFLFLKGITSVNIPGQVEVIKFDVKKRMWVNISSIGIETLPIWNYTKSGQEIIKALNRGSHGSSKYYIIPNYKNDKVAIFIIPQSQRLRCDNFSNDKTKEIDCNNFYKSIIDQYNDGQALDNTWLPENYINSIYSEAENIVKSYREIIK